MKFSLFFALILMFSACSSLKDRKPSQSSESSSLVNPRFAEITCRDGSGTKQGVIFNGFVAYNESDYKTFPDQIGFTLSGDSYETQSVAYYRSFTCERPDSHFPKKDSITLHCASGILKHHQGYPCPDGRQNIRSN